MTHRYIKIGVTARRARARVRRPAVVDAARRHRVLQARRRSDDEPAAVGRQAAAAARLRRARLDPACKPDTLEYRFKVQNNRRATSIGTSSSVVHRHRARHVQGRGGGRAEGQADARRLPRRAERRDGEVPVEVRSASRPRPDRRLRMASLGTFLLLAAFVVCSYAAVVSVVGARRGIAPADRERHRRVLPDLPR